MGEQGAFRSESEKVRRVTPERCMRVRLLLDVMGERWEQAGGRDETPMGRPAPTTWLDCVDCHGTGRSGGCSRCDGSGLLLVDPYTSTYDLYDKVGRVSVQERETMELWEIDRVLEKIQEDVATREGHLGEIPGVREPNHVRQARRALAALRDGGSTCRALYRAVAVMHWPAITNLSVTQEDARKRTALLEELAVRWMAQRMRGPIPLPEAAEHAVQLMRKVWVDELRAKGLGRREIARALGVSVRTVSEGRR